ncbi:MAG TPA: phosphate ABC transporter permease subunit PstC [Ktedonobacterales bacterium]
MRWRDRISQLVFAASAGLVILLMASIIIFIGSNAYQTFTVDHVNPLRFFFSSVWAPDSGQVGALVLITGTITVTVLSTLLSTPISVGIALFITEVAPPWARQFMQPVIELLAGIPSIVYGFLGLVIIVPLVAKTYNYFAGGYFNTGFGVIAATLVLTVMILPTIGSIAIDTLAALPNGLREASMALGATRWQTIRRTLLPAASSGIFTGVVLGLGRAVGETLAVSFVIGSNVNSFPFRISNFYPYFNLTPTSTITVQLLFDFAEAPPGSLNLHAIWTLAFVLLMISFGLVVLSRWIASRNAFNVTSDKPRKRWLRSGLAPTRLYLRRAS